MARQREFEEGRVWYFKELAIPSEEDVFGIDSL
jgi:hypothetical protein